MNNLENSVKVLHVRNQKRADSIKKLDKRIDDCKSEDKALYDKITSLEDKIAKLEKNQNYKKLWQENTKDYNILARKRLEDYCKIEKLDKKIKELEQKANRTGQFHLDAINDKFAKEDKKINKLYDLLKSVTFDYELRKELNGIYKVMEMNADDIQELQDKLNKGV